MFDSIWLRTIQAPAFEAGVTSLQLAEITTLLYIDIIKGVWQRQTP